MKLKIEGSEIDIKTLLLGFVVVDALIHLCIGAYRTALDSDRKYKGLMKERKKEMKMMQKQHKKEMKKMKKQQKAESI